MCRKVALLYERYDVSKVYCLVQTRKNSVAQIRIPNHAFWTGHILRHFGRSPDVMDSWSEQSIHVERPEQVSADVPRPWFSQWIVLGPRSYTVTYSDTCHTMSDQHTRGTTICWM